MQYCEGVPEGIGANVTPVTVQRVSKCLGVLQNATGAFDSTFDVATPGDKHSPARRDKDLLAIVEQLHFEMVFSVQDGQQHPSFKSSKHTLTNIAKDKVISWLQRAVRHILEYQQCIFTSEQFKCSVHHYNN